LVRVYLPESANEARLMDRLDAHINKIVEMGFLRKLRSKGGNDGNDGKDGKDGEFEIQRILKAFVDAQWLSEFDRRLAVYAEHLKNESGDSKDSGQGADA
jgi:Domain of unknown function (DUF4194)